MLIVDDWIEFGKAQIKVTESKTVGKYIHYKGNNYYKYFTIISLYSNLTKPSLYEHSVAFTSFIYRLTLIIGK